MNAATRKKPADEHQEHYQHWTLRILEKQGVATLFAIILLGGMMKMSEYHLRFLDEQTNQMKLQTRSLEAIEEWTRTNSESNRRQEDLLQDVSDRIEANGKP